MNSRLLMSLLVTMVLLNSCYSPISGTVVDAETNAPIEGAVVLVEWTKTHGVGEHWTESYKVAEALTDKDGKFTLPGCYSPFVNKPDVTVYRKGYVAWSSRWIFPDRRNRTDFKWRDYTFRLEHFKSEYLYYEHEMFLESSIHVGLGTVNKNAIVDAFKWERDKASAERDKNRRGQ